ncbi:MAG: hypothetical protein Q9227_000997 [Pyrenula ochraceoflavens]
MMRPPLQRTQRPLEDQTNESDGRRSKEELCNHTLKPSRSLRRTDSIQFGRSSFDSSSTPSSGDSSIYNAPIVVVEEVPADSGEDERLEEAFKRVPPFLMTIGAPEDEDSTSPNKIRAPTPTPTHTPTRSRSNWPRTPLETITEQRSISTLGRTASARNLQTKESKISALRSALKEHGSSLENLPHQSPTPLNSKSSPGSPASLLSPPMLKGQPSHRRSLSLNDLDCLFFHFSCLPTSSGHACDKSLTKSSSSTSTTTLTPFISSNLYLCGIFSHPASPVQPTLPPPTRSKTPPGLPSFGSREARNYFLGDPMMRTAGARMMARRRRMEGNYNNNDHLAQGQQGGDQDQNEQHHNDKSLSFFRRWWFLSTAQLGTRDSPTSSAVSPATRAPLPPGVLLRADDGTLVRGRFGARVSGHGVGGLGLEQSGIGIGVEAHPWHREGMECADVVRRDGDRGTGSRGGGGNVEEERMSGAVGRGLEEEDWRRDGEGKGWWEGLWEEVCLWCCAWDERELGMIGRNVDMRRGNEEHALDGGVRGRTGTGIGGYQGALSGERRMMY